jgi:hypothetical protein
MAAWMINYFLEITRQPHDEGGRQRRQGLVLMCAYRQSLRPAAASFISYGNTRFKEETVMEKKSQSEITISEVQKYIDGIDFPVGKTQLLDHARQNDAPDEILDFIQEFPSRQYGSPMDVSRVMGQMTH